MKSLALLLVLPNANSSNHFDTRSNKVHWNNRCLHGFFVSLDKVLASSMNSVTPAVEFTTTIVLELSW